MERRHFLTSAAAAIAALNAGDAWVADLLTRRPRAHGAGDADPPTETDPTSEAEHALLAALAETLIPTTDTPGAITAGVPEFILRLIEEWMTPEEARTFRAGLTGLDAEARTAHGNSFAALPDEVRLALLQKWDAASIAARHAGEPPVFFARLKTLVLVGYYTSAVGQDEELHVRFGGGADQPGGPNCTTIPMRI